MSLTQQKIEQVIKAAKKVKKEGAHVDTYYNAVYSLFDINPDAHQTSHVIELQATIGQEFQNLLGHLTVPHYTDSISFHAYFENGTKAIYGRLTTQPISRSFITIPECDKARAFYHLHTNHSQIPDTRCVTYKQALTLTRFNFPECFKNIGLEQQRDNQYSTVAYNCQNGLHAAENFLENQPSRTDQVDTQVGTDYSPVLDKILYRMDTHRFILNGGSTLVNGRRVSQGAYEIYQLIFAHLNNESKQITSLEDFTHIANKIRLDILQLNTSKNKTQPHGGFFCFGLGRRDETTIKLYNDIIGILDNAQMPAKTQQQGSSTLKTPEWLSKTGTPDPSSTLFSNTP